MALQQLANSLVNDLIRDHGGHYGGASITCSVYDTAWLSILVKPVDGQATWLFPCCFDYLLATQHKSGGWALGDDVADTTLNTVAALYAICKHRASKNVSNLYERIKSASQYLQDNLQRLRISGALPAGFELLLPTLLTNLEQEYDIMFEFPAKRELLKMQDERRGRFDLERLYTGSDHITLNYLEAFIGHVDFDTLRPYKVFGSMMASPSSTTAYLMNTTVWDAEAEEYLRKVIMLGPGKGNGGVPSVFPSTLFEYSWVVSTLIESGFTYTDLGPANLTSILKVLHQAFSSDSGTVGFQLGPDDIAGCVITLTKFGVAASPRQLAEKYSSSARFEMSSLSPNCRDLIAMCISDERYLYAHQIEHAARIICEAWWRGPDSFEDQRIESRHYSMMLISKALKSVIDAWCQKLLPGIPLQLLRDSIVVVFQILVRLLQAQGQDASWGGRRESTAFALITINEIASLSIVKPFLDQIKDSIQRGRTFLSKTLTCRTRPESIWIQKVSYGSSALSQAFSLAALNSSIGDASCPIQELLFEDLQAVLQPSKFFSQLPMFSSTPVWCIAAWLIEGALFQHRLGERCLDGFPQRVKQKLKYLSIIPFTWTASNIIHGAPIGPNTMLEMMAICALAYQIDDFIEIEVAHLPSSAIATLRLSIPKLFREVEFEGSETRANDEQVHSNTDEKIQNMPIANFTEPTSSWLHHQGNSDASETPNALEARFEHISRELKGIIRHLWQAPYVRTTAHHSRDQLKVTVVSFITAHLIQTEQSKLLAAQPPAEEGRHKTLVNPPSSLLTWVRTVSSDHTIGPFAVAAFCCMYGHGFDGSSSPQSNYILQDVAHHLASLCRLYNDYGSITRDRAEDNLNIINFPEFQGHPDEIALKENLASIAEYERRCLHASMAELRPLVSEKLHVALTVFCHTAEMYNQMYMLKDLTATFNKL
ncbi:hypothetical protein NUW58_g1623 [Xylaria curta]|uniref:Uncharacterized protein n=1 Tax=Xylaria curta TaxID=42375 RepID=A0ACC1PJI5_9PEZI|nr:hypothetical protein NUW58_g1623 [Xylaria curta]